MPHAPCIFSPARGQATGEVISLEELPIGFMMALAENGTALRRFAGLADDTRQEVVSQARQAASREEMEAIVRSLT